MRRGVGVGAEVLLRCSEVLVFEQDEGRRKYNVKDLPLPHNLKFSKISGDPSGCSELSGEFCESQEGVYTTFHCFQ